MSKVVRFTAPPSIALHKLPEAEIRKTVAEEATKALAKLPKEIRPAGVSAVSLSSRAVGTGGDWGGWAEWTRACADARARIDDYVDPVESVINEASLSRPGNVEFKDGLTIRNLGAIQKEGQ